MFVQDLLIYLDYLLVDNHSNFVVLGQPLVPIAQTPHQYPYLPQHPPLPVMPQQAPQLPPSLPQKIQLPPNNLPPLPSLPYQDMLKEKEEAAQVKFMGPIPPPVKLPPKWKSAKDKYGRPYYYHIKIRISQWEPPEYPKPAPVQDAQDDGNHSILI